MWDLFGAGEVNQKLINEYMETVVLGGICLEQGMEHKNVSTGICIVNKVTVSY